MPKIEKWIKPARTVLCEIFTVCTIIMLFAGSAAVRKQVDYDPFIYS